MKKVVIIGCGYLGQEAASIWKKKGDYVTTTTRDPARLNSLSRVSQKSVLIKGNDEDELVPLLAENEVIVVTVGADSPEHYESAYLNTSKIIRHLALEMGRPCQLIYASSTSVYGDHHGRWVDEESDLLASSENGKILIESEKHYLALKEIGWDVCILRLAEIYGPGRELSKRIKELKNQTLGGSGDQYSNMVHKSDCAHALDYALRHHLQGVYNVCDDEHPTRKELYDQISHKLGLPRVRWDPSHPSLHPANKRVSNHKIKAEGFAFIFPLRQVD